MKWISKSMALMAFVAVFASCTREELEVITPTAPATPTNPGSQVYHFELIDGETRATLEEEGVFWEAGDKVGLFLGEYHGEAAVNVDASPKTVSFTAAEPVAPDTYAYAYYPYGELNAEPSATRVVFPAQQKGTAMSAMPMAGVPFKVTSEGATNGQIRFLNLGAVIDFRVFSATYSSEKVQSITFTATSGSHPVSGAASINLTGVVAGNEESLALTWSGNAGTSSVTLKQAFTVAADKDAAIASGSHFMVVAPGTYSGTITVTTTAATYTFAFTDRVLSRNTIKAYNMNLNNATRVPRQEYVKVTSSSGMVSGGKYLIVYESGPYAFKPIKSGNTLEASASNVFSVSIEDGRIKSTVDVDACQVILEASSNKYYMKAVADNVYFYPSGSNLTAGTSANTACTITNDAGVVNITAGTNNYFKYSTSSNYFKQSTYNSSRELALYLLSEVSSTTQELKYSASSYSFILDGQTPPVALTDTPTLSGDMTFVTYSSSNTSVATVDAVSGTVTVKGLGSTVITATAEASDDYQEATASYTLTVWPMPTYSIENDKVAAYLDLVDANPYNPPTDYSMTYMTQNLYGGNTNQTNRLDWPKPVPVSWTNPASGNGAKVVYIYNDEARTKLELSVSVSSNTATSADVYNLIPNRTYYYSVTNEGEVFATGKFGTTGRRRMIKVGESKYGKQFANNCRDFGGQRTISGKTIKYGKMFRGSNMDKTGESAGAQDFLKNYLKIGLDVDLRSSTDGTEGAGSNHLYDALGLGAEGHTTESFNSWNDFKNQFKDQNNNQYYKMTIILTMIFDAVKNNKGVYIHCMVGADRTGYTCMLLEAILGVEQGWCDVDYELTSFSGAVDEGKPRIRRNDLNSNLYPNWYYRSTSTTVQGVDYIYSLSGGEYGTTFQAKAINYVVNTLGIPYEDVNAFQNNMLE